MALSMDATVQVKVDYPGITNHEAIGLSPMQDINIPSAYIRIMKVEGNKSNLAFNVEYLSNNERVAVRWFEFTPSMSGDNFIKQAYRHLKSLDEFSGAEDV